MGALPLPGPCSHSPCPSQNAGPTIEVSLRDPSGGDIIEVPVRGTTCLHPQSFDLARLLQSPASNRFLDPVGNRACVQFTCPVCKDPIKSSDLLLDCFSGLVGPLVMRVVQGCRGMAGLWGPLRAHYTPT